MLRRLGLVDAKTSQSETTTDGSRAERGPPVLFVVDDDVPTLDLLVELAQDDGWSAFGFTRLTELVPALAERRPTLLILDDDLPDGRGGDLARRLRSDPRMTDVPLLVCTAAHPMRQAEIGAWAPVVSKPFDIEEIERFLDAAAAHEQGGQSHHQAAG